MVKSKAEKLKQKSSQKPTEKVGQNNSAQSAETETLSKTRSKRPLAMGKQTEVKTPKHRKVTNNPSNKVVDECFKRVLLREDPEAAKEAVEMTVEHPNDVNNNASVMMDTIRSIQVQGQVQNPVVGSAKSLIQAIKSKRNGKASKTEQRGQLKDQFYPEKLMPQTSSADQILDNEQKHWRWGRCVCQRIR